MVYYGVDEIREEERKEFLVWYESQRFETSVAGRTTTVCKVRE